MGMSNFYKRLRKKVGNELIFIPSVATIIRNDHEEILLQNKGNGEKWSLPAGAIEPGEAPAEAIVREVWEETGLFITPQKLLGVFGGKEYRYQYPNGDKVEYNIFLFECVIKKGELLPNDEETVELQFFSQESMPELALPYPKDILFNKERNNPYFQWDDQWLNDL
ncbi:NUDIX domain-containing protein [Aerococcaceae bacterium DSM 111022]|nr:NUDIX domain-containing protein [Aerococcaceae bacterium DSM 111022]